MPKRLNAISITMKGNHSQPLNYRNRAGSFNRINRVIQWNSYLIFKLK